MFASKFSALFFVGISLSIPAASAGEKGFTLCGSECGDAKFYVGYNRTNSAKLDRAISSSPTQQYKIYPHIADLQKSDLFPNINEQKIDLENGTYVTSLHRLDGIRVGFMRKSELMNVTAKSAAETGASVHMVWGDTLKISSGSIRRGTPVKLQIQRTVGGFGAPVTDFARYKLKSQTFVNGRFLPDLDYTLEKKPGVGQVEKKVGNDKLTTSIIAEVGDTIKLESLLMVDDGVVASSTPQILNGADSVEYNIKVLTHGVDLRSESGTFPN
jgi:hypothetical protein